MLARIGGLFRGVGARLDALLHPRRLDRDLQEKMRFHVEQQVSKNKRSGMSRAQAERQARQALGNVGQIQEEHRDARGLRWADELRQDIGYGARRLLARPWISAAAVLTLAVGIGSVTTIYGAVVALVFEPLQIPAIDEVMVLGEAPGGAGWRGEGWAHPADYTAWRREPVFTKVGGVRPWFVTMTRTEEPAEVFGYQVFGDYFPLLGVDAAVGRTLATDADLGGEPEVVLSHRFWRAQLGADPSVVGRRVRFEDREHVIVGVMPDAASFPMGTDVWASPTEELSASESFERANIRVLGRLAPGVTLQRARAAMRVVAQRIASIEPARHADLTVILEPIHSAVTYGTGPLMTFLMGAAGFLLLLVCANVANLQLMHGAACRREMALRSALGASRGRLVRQLLAESLILALVSGVLAAVVAGWGTGFLRVALSGDWWRFFFVGVDRIGVNAEVLLFGLVVSLASVFVFGLLPALRASRVDLTTELKQGRDAAPGRGPRGALVVVEVVLSLVIVTGAWLMAQAGVSVGISDLGFNEDVASFAVRTRSTAYRDPVALRQLIGDTRERVRATPGIAVAATSSQMPGISPGRGIALRAVDENAGGLAEVSVRVVSDAFFATLGIPLIAGREFTGSDRAGAAPVAVLSQVVADRLWPGGSAVGRRVRLEGEEDWLIVVGVAANVAGAWNDLSPLYAVYVPAPQRPPARMVFLMQGPPGAVELARERVWERYPDVPLPASRSIEETIAELAAPIRMASELMSAFAGIALLICLGGIHALVGYLASLRVREVGVHMAIGADRSAVLRLFVGRGVRLGGVGLLIGLPAGYLMATLLVRAMGRFGPNGIAASEVPFLALGGVLLVLSALASYLPARRAAAIDPATVLRAE